MSLVRRCDNPACVNGPGGTVAVADGANPDGWTVASVDTLVGGTSPTPGDFDSPLCAAQALFGANCDVAAKGTTKPIAAKPT